jgi:SAM-dependent methyltransferase
MSLPKQTAEAYGYDKPANHPARHSAEVIVELLCNSLTPKSVLDVGCGIGIFLNEFLKRGVEDVHGIDGEWVPRSSLLIPEQSFSVHDLTQPLKLDKRFDLVLCVEVAEHLPANAADNIVRALISHGSTVCFSAAIPGQGGYEHINEQFQCYWIEKFANYGYRAYDMLRPKLWFHRDVEFYYKQNLLIFSTLELPYPAEFVSTFVHPELYMRKTDPKNYSLRQIIAHLPYYVKRSLFGK